MPYLQCCRSKGKREKSMRQLMTSIFRLRRKIRPLLKSTRTILGEATS